MKTLLLSLLLAAPLAQAAETSLTEANIRVLYDDMTAAAQANDVEGVLAHMTEDVRISIEMPVDMGGRLELDRSQYRDLLRQGWQNVQAYQLEATIYSINIAKDGRSASVQDVTAESMQVQGMPITTQTLENVTIRLVDGAPKIERIDAVVRP